MIRPLRLLDRALVAIGRAPVPVMLAIVCVIAAAAEWVAR